MHPDKARVSYGAVIGAINDYAQEQNMTWQRKTS
jgi:hypothetical protein